MDFKVQRACVKEFRIVRFAAATRACWIDATENKKRSSLPKEEADRNSG